MHQWVVTVAVVIASLGVVGIAAGLFAVAWSIRSVARHMGTAETAYRLGRRRSKLEDTGELRLVR